MRSGSPWDWALVKLPDLFLMSPFASDQFLQYAAFSHHLHVAIKESATLNQKDLCHHFFFGNIWILKQTDVISGGVSHALDETVDCRWWEEREEMSLSLSWRNSNNPAFPACRLQTLIYFSIPTTIAQLCLAPQSSKLYPWDIYWSFKHFLLRYRGLNWGWGGSGRDQG